MFQKNNTYWNSFITVFPYNPRKQIMSWEVRWFHKDMTNYFLVIQWFEGKDKMYVKENIREDRYIFLRNCEEIGIKFRDFNYNNKNKSINKLEIKWRKNKKSNFWLVTNDIHGKLENWIKYELVIKEQYSSSKSLINFFSTANKPVIKLKKLRFLRRFVFQDDMYKPIEWIDIEKDDGLQFEITKISNGVLSWWSIGFENIGKKNNQIKFKRAVKNILTDFVVKLENKNSMGYPEWINKNLEIWHHKRN